MKNILITGVSGYLGTRLAEALADEEMAGEVVGMDIRPPVRASDRITYYQKDIRDDAIGPLFSRHSIDTVLHLAFVVKPIHNLKKMHDIDVNGTRNMLELARMSGVKHFIAISSTLAYGAHPDNPKRIREDAPLRGNKTFPYGFYKAATDQMMQDYAAGHPEMKITILRPCTVFGPSVDNYISRMLFLPLTMCVKGCDPPVQFVHEQDFVAACMAALANPVPGAFNIAGDGTLTVSEIAKMLKTRVAPIPAKILYPALECLWRLRCPKIEVNRGYLDYIRYPFVASNKKAKKELGFFPGYSSMQTVEETVRSRKK